MKRLIGIVTVAFVLFGLVPLPLLATTGPVFWVQANAGYSGGNTWNDLSGFGRHMQLNGIWYHSLNDYYGGSYGEMYFDSGAYGQSPLVSFASDTVSMEVIFYTIDTTINTQMVFYNGSESFGNGYGIALVSNGAVSEIQIRYGGMTSLSTGIFINPETWYHTVVTIGSNGDLNVYVNGILRHSRSFIVPNTPAMYTRIGNSDVSSDYGLWGSVSVARMYDRELTNSEVWRLYQGDLSASTSTVTRTSTPSHTPTATPIPSHTLTATLTPSRTPTATLMPSHTPTATPMPSHTLTATLTPSHTPTATSTDTAIATNTPSATSTYSPSPSRTQSMPPTKTPSPTLSSAHKTATSGAVKTATSAMAKTRTAIMQRTQTAASIRTRTAIAARTRTAEAARTRTAIMAKTNTVIAKTRTSTATRRRVIIATMTPTIAVTR